MTLPSDAEIKGGRETEPENWKPNCKMLYITAKANGWTRQQVHSLINLHFGRGSTKELLWLEYRKVMDWVSLPPPEGFLD